MHSITVLMSTYNGEKYIREQIKSLLKQKNVNLSILVRDDGSRDSTPEILEEYQIKKILKWYKGKNLKSANSFLNLIQNSPDTEYYAFCDQDDVWNEDKLERAIHVLQNMGDTYVPRLYCANYQLVDENLNPLADNGHVSTTTFGAALVSSCCTGCTVVFNHKLMEILRMGIPKVVVMHDDWAHKVCLAVGGTVYYDEYKALKYRQHGANVDGGLHTKKEKIQQIMKRIQSKECIRSEQLKEIVRIYSHLISEENSRLLNKVILYKNYSIFNRMKLAESKEITTPYKRLNKGFKIAIILKYF